MIDDMQPVIKTFNATFHYDEAGARLRLAWQTQGAASCRIEGVAVTHVPDAEGAGSHEIAITSELPLRTHYTLIAVGQDAARTVRRTLALRYVQDHAPVELDSAYHMVSTPDSAEVLALEAVGISAFDARTLERRSRPLFQALDGTGIDTFALDPDGSTVYALSFGGQAYVFDRATGERRDDGTYAAAGSEPPYHWTITDDHAVLVTNELQIDARIVGANQFLLLDRLTFTPVHPVPLATDHTLIHVVGRQSKRHFLGAPEGVRVLDTSTLSEPYTAIERTLPGMLALSPDEQTLYSVAFDADARSFVLAAHDTATGALHRETPISIGFNPIFMALLGVPFADIVVSPDGALLFVLGGEPEGLRRNQIQTTLLVYDAVTLEQASWSPLTFGGLMPVAVAVAPDASRLFVVAGDRIGSDDATTWLFALDACFG